MKRDSYYRQLSTSELITLIIKKYHKPLRLNNPKIIKDLEYLSDKYKHKEPNISLIYDTFTRFDSIIIKHINKEEEIFFKAIKQLENTIEICENINPKSIEESKIFLKEQEDEHSEIDEHLIEIDGLCSKINKISDPIFYEFMKKTNKMISETKDHAKIEDFYLNEKIKFYLNLI